MDKNKILDKAKKTEYKHHSWFKEGVTVFHAMEYFSESVDAYLDLKSNIKYSGQVPGIVSTNPGDIIMYCFKNIDTHWKYLRIRAEGGSDSGKLKIQTYVILAGL